MRTMFFSCFRTTAGSYFSEPGDLQGDGQPREVHLVQFPPEAALLSYMNDERRSALAADRDLAVERTEILHVRLV